MNFFTSLTRLLILFLVILNHTVNAQIAAPEPVLFVTKTGNYIVGQDLGVLAFQLKIASGDYALGAAIAAIVEGDPSEGVIPSSLVFRTGQSALSDQAILKTNGYFGLNTANPTERLDVNGNIRTRGAFIALGTNDGMDVGSLLQQRALAHSSTDDYEDRLIINFEGDFEGGTSVEGPAMYLEGKLGVGTQDLESYQDYMLYVNGGILCTELKVEEYLSWPDYVFDENYNLMSLCELQQFIIENNHLPNIPSAIEIANGGFELSDMQARVLEKTEETVLYLIDVNATLEAEIENRNQELELLNRRLEKMENQIETLINTAGK